MIDLLQHIENRSISKGVVIWWLGGPSWVMKTPNSIIYVDLFTGPAPKETLVPLTKNYADLISPSKIAKVDYVLSTHEHIDHCHYESLNPIYLNTQAIFIGGTSSVKKFSEWGFSRDRIIHLGDCEKYSDGNNIFVALPNKDCVDPGAVSILIETEKITVFEGGDSLYFDGFKQVGQEWEVDIALLNFFKNPAEIDMVMSMNPSQVAQAAMDLGAKVLIPKHWNIWKEMVDDPMIIEDYLENSDTNLKVLNMGEEFIYQAGSWKSK